MHLSNLIRGAHRCVDDFIAQRVKGAGLSVEKYRILAALHDSDGRSMSSLAATVFVDSPTMTKIVDRMVTSSLVYRAPDSTDRRKVLIYKAQKGAQVFEGLSSIETELQSHLERELGQSDIEHLMETLQSILESTQAGEALAPQSANLGSVGATR